MKKQRLYFVILAVIVNALFLGCEGLAELAHGPKPEAPPVNYATNHTVTFNANGGNGTAPSSQTVSSGSSIVLPSGGGLSRSGYTFSGWNANASGTGMNHGAGSPYTVTGNVTLYAQWADASTVWTVRFETNGGGPVGDVIVLKNTAVNRPTPDPTKTGYTLDGWYTNTGLTAPYNFSSIVIGNITLYAKWSPITYTVSYNANGGTGDMASSSHTYDENKNLSSNGFTYTGHAFAGWLRTSGGAVEFSNGASVRNLTTTAGATVTLFAKWNPITYTVSYNANGGTGTMNPNPSSHTYDEYKALTANGFTYTGYTFAGWARTSSGAVEFSNSESVRNLTTTAGATVTLFAKWELVTNVPGSTLAAKLSWLQSNAVSNVDYIVEVTANESLSPTTLSYSGRTNIGITLKGISAVRTVNLSSDGAMFTVSNGVTLVLDNNITLQGRSDNTTRLVNVFGGTLVMNTGAKITGNTGGSGVSVGGDLGSWQFVSGTFTMNGGEISGNTTTGNGGGVYVFGSTSAGGTFTMKGGKISDNTSTNSTGGGGGVSVEANNSTFTMEGGEISGNTASNGGGVYVRYGPFTMSGGTISNNTATGGGGGVNVFYGTFTMSGTAKIFGNTASNGGGVYVSPDATFTMEGGEISGNTGSGNGGGVSVYSGGFYRGCIFTKTGGTIYGYSASDTVNSNVVKNSSGTVQNNSGHAVYAYFSSNSYKRRETTANSGVNMACNGNTYPPTFSGGWE